MVEDAEDMLAVVKELEDGGSGWIYTEANFNTWKAGNPTDANKYLLNSSYYLTDASTTAGQRTGNGQAKITPVT